MSTNQNLMQHADKGGGIVARVSRKNGVSESQPKGQRQTVFRTALYVRLSVEDNGKVDADSIENQELLLRNYLAERPYLELKEVYADNGYTGTDFVEVR